MTQAPLDRVSGTLTRTYSIVADTELTGDVTCAVADATPCFSFAVPGVGLRLNGFTVTGKGDPVTGCGGTPTKGEIGIRPTASVRYLSTALASSSASAVTVSR